ncbi:hypothetical protein ACWYXK_21150 [Janthinobacterium lividum]
MTIPDLFIIESLDEDDENHHRYEGQRLADLLRLSGKNPKYIYFQSKKELPHLLKLFELSNYRYLHISCHGSKNGFWAGEDHLNYETISVLLEGYLEKKRVFFSACLLGNEKFSTCLVARNEGLRSIVAPVEKIDFDYAAAMWSAFYVSVFARKEDAMSGKDILRRIKALCSLFPVDFHVSTYNEKTTKWNHEVCIKTPLNKTKAGALKK